MPRQEFIVCIPSYKRPDIITKKTLKTLADGGIAVDKIYVFVANEEEREAYKDVKCKKLIVGVPGLAAQRKFICDYFPVGKWIVFMDDDITSIKRLDSGRLVPVENLTELFMNAFRVIGRAGANIWGVYPAASALYMSDTVSTDLCYLPGGLFGIHNSHKPEYELQFGSIEEDKERTLRYWEADGVICRFNNTTIITNNYAAGGMMDENPNRKADTKAGTEQLVEAFPKLIRQIYKEKHGIWDIRFNRVPRTLPDSEIVSVLPIRNTSRYIYAREQLIKELQRITLPKILPSRINKKNGKYIKNRGDIIGVIGRTQQFGYGRTRTKGWAEMRSNKTLPKLFHLLIELGNQIVPIGWEYNFITLNDGVKAKKHVDVCNCGKSVIVGIGEFEGGKLRVYDVGGTAYEALDIKDKPTMFNGAILPHETEPFTGRRWTIIYFNQSAGKVEGVSMVGV